MPAMRLFTCFLQLLAGLALPAVPPQQWALSAANGSSEVEVVPFQEVWGRSYCRALERLVDIVSEYPGEVEHMFSPSCVSLLRCTGCCGDENLHCVPVETVNVTMQLLKIRSGDRPSYVELTFSQHVRCECRPLREKMKPERRRPKGRGKRKREKQRHTDCHLTQEIISCHGTGADQVLPHEPNPARAETSTPLCEDRDAGEDSGCGDTVPRR
ncbi:placenta growth factor isoform X2 [Orcinus orca]|uniref:placenta growth factor isoform X2 n=1 Tax=Orcinus orca TaxID=9733 RepID=UPI0014424186|nr:placenta growth factor isoform X2 [Orcinus orca]